MSKSFTVFDGVFCIFPEQQKSTIVLFDQGENQTTSSVSSEVDDTDWVLLPFNLVPPAPLSLKSQSFHYN